MSLRRCVVFAVLACAWSAHAWPKLTARDVYARTTAGWVWGVQRFAENKSTYASFRGVPYAKQPLGALRFKELEPPVPWNHVFDAREDGPVCFQTDVLYGKLMQSQDMDEACIHANIHVPYDALPTRNYRTVRALYPPFTAGLSARDEEVEPVKGLPILVFIHGGGFAFGSGNTDVHGPEYLVSRGVIVITFNYRLNALGFLSLNTTKIPGNAGLRDMVTLLRWVQENARYFGGDPDNVTIGGQSAGSVATHLLTLSKAAEGLFKRAILMSGVATTHFFSPTPAFAQFISKLFFNILDIKTTNPDEIHQQLIDMPVEKINDANAKLIHQFGLSTFMPTVETPLPGVTTVLDDYPEVLMANGRGKDIPLMVGFTDAECETFRRRLLEFDIVKKIEDNPTLKVTQKLLFSTPPDSVMDLVNKIDNKYFNGNITVDNYIKFCSDSYFEYPALDVVEKRAAAGGAPVFLYRFTYESENSVLQETNGIKHEKAGHIEDMTYIFKTNFALGSYASGPPLTSDDYMKLWMTTFFINFITNGEPVSREVKDNSTKQEPSSWPPVAADDIVFQNIEKPGEYHLRGLSQRQWDQVDFFNSLVSANRANRR